LVRDQTATLIGTFVQIVAPAGPARIRQYQLGGTVPADFRAFA
jgi:hypothetical protein